MNYVIKMADSESSYFMFYALLNFITNLELPNNDNQISREEIAKVTLNDIDYPTLCSSLIKS